MARRFLPASSQACSLCSRLELCGESFYNDMLTDVIAELEGKGLLEDSDGAKVLFCEAGKPPLMVRPFGSAQLSIHLRVSVFSACAADS